MNERDLVYVRTRNFLNNEVFVGPGDLQKGEGVEATLPTVAISGPNTLIPTFFRLALLTIVFGSVIYGVKAIFWLREPLQGATVQQIVEALQYKNPS